MGRAFPQRGVRAVDEHSEIYVGLDVAKARHHPQGVPASRTCGRPMSSRPATFVGSRAALVLTIRTNRLARIIHWGSAGRCDAGSGGAGFRGVEDAGDRGLRLRR